MYNQYNQIPEGHLLLKEYNAFNFKDQSATVEAFEDTFILRGVCQRANAKNGNERIYPRHVLESNIQRYYDMINDGRSAGELDHRNDPEVRLENVSHMVTELKWMGDDVVAAFKLMSGHPKGEMAKSLVRNGMKLGTSTRGVGSLTEAKGFLNVNDDYYLICWDLVHDPSTTGAFMLKEGRYIKVDGSDLITPNRQLILPESKNERLKLITNDIMRGWK